MKKWILLLALSVCLILPSIGYVETEEDVRAQLQQTMEKLEDSYEDKLSEPERLQLSFLHDWADRYVENSEWVRFAEDYTKCQSVEELSSLLKEDYIGITQAPNGQMQRDEIQKRCMQIMQAAGIDATCVPYLSMGHKGIRSNGNSAGWFAVASDIPGEERYIPQLIMELDVDGNIQNMQYVFEQEEPMEESAEGAAVSAEQAQQIAEKFFVEYVILDSEIKTSVSQSVYEGVKEDPYWKVVCEVSEDSHYQIDVGSVTGHVYAVCAQ